MKYNKNSVLNFIVERLVPFHHFDVFDRATNNEINVILLIKYINTGHEHMYILAFISEL
jgi:hypothetical protein